MFFGDMLHDYGILPARKEACFMLKAVLAAALMLSLATAASAQQQQGDRERGDRVCRSDATRLCRSVLGQGDFAILACFQENARRLSRPCRSFLQEMGQL